MRGPRVNDRGLHVFHSMAFRLGCSALSIAAALLLTSASSKACWHCGVGPAPYVEYFAPPVHFSTPPVDMFAEPRQYAPLNYGAIRYNRPCLVSDGRYSYPVSCIDLADHHFISAYNGW
jgi:hypothetical protein